MYIHIYICVFHPQQWLEGAVSVYFRLGPGRRRNNNHNHNKTRQDRPGQGRSDTYLSRSAAAPAPALAGVPMCSSIICLARCPPVASKCRLTSASVLHHGKQTGTQTE